MMEVVMDGLLRYVPIHDLPPHTLVDEEYLLSQYPNPLWFIILQTMLGLFPRPLLIKGRRHWDATQVIECLNQEPNHR